MQIVRIQATTNVQWNFFQEEGQYVALCEPMGRTAVGETNSDMLETIQDISNHLMRDLVKRGEFEIFLRAKGWSQVGLRTDLPPDQMMFDLPTDIVQRTASEALH